MVQGGFIEETNGFLWFLPLTVSSPQLSAGPGTRCLCQRVQRVAVRGYDHRVHCLDCKETRVGGLKSTIARPSMTGIFTYIGVINGVDVGISYASPMDGRWMVKHRETRPRLLALWRGCGFFRVAVADLVAVARSIRCPQVPVIWDGKNTPGGFVLENVTVRTAGGVY